MKALSLRQPWADWVIQGKKTLELRSWTVNYRGPLAIHASQIVNEEACRAHGIRPEQLTTGAIIGVVELVGIELLDDTGFAKRKNEHLAEGLFKPPLYAWRLTNAKILPSPIPYHGRMGLFSIPDELVEQDTLAEPQIGEISPNLDAITSMVDWDARFSFELRLIPEPANSTAQAAYRLALYQRIVEPPSAQYSLAATTPARMRMLVELGGSLLKAVSDQVLDTLRQNEYKITDLSLSRREPFILSEESGVRLGLLFMAVRPITKMARVEAISAGIRAMTSEELYYWFSKCTSTASAERAQKALRLLLADE
jgi:hypothetical protein